jgi:hypothetical protein
MAKCFISDNEDNLTDIIVNGTIYKISEKLTEDYPLKQIKDMILKKITEEEDKKKNALLIIESALSTLGISKEAFGHLLLGGNKPLPQNVPQNIPQTTPQDKDDGFKEVDGSLKSVIRANIHTEDGVAGVRPAYNDIKDKDKKSVIEEGKKVKNIGENTTISKSNMGTTIVTITDNDPKLDKLLRQVDGNYELVRKNISGGQAAECSFCDGTGITKIGSKLCPKCKGSGFINL